MVLLVVDAQKGITNEKLYQYELFITNVQKLIQQARENKVEVIYIRHNDGPNSDLTKGLAEFSVADEFRPLPTEKIFDKNVNSPFRQSGLLEYLKAKHELELIIVGLQTDYCIDATIKCGFEHGFHITVPAYANTTVDNPYLKASASYHYYNEFLLPNRYATCISVDETIQKLNLNKRAWN